MDTQCSTNSSDEAASKSFDANRFIEKFKRHGYKAFSKLYPSSLEDIRCLGYTGETYYDYDKPHDKKDKITIIHFNDVYNIESPFDGDGGVSRFVSAIHQHFKDNPLILFSGDAFNPSILSNFTKGRHMVPFLNMLKIHTACVGNHDLDFGLDHMEYMAGTTRFPWLLSNVYDPHTNSTLLEGTSRYHLFEWQGHRVGIIGLVEFEWFKTLPLIDLNDILYKDYVQVANELSKLLRNKECELIIALTHMRANHDERLAREAQDIDLILGGHDHEYFGFTRIGNTIVGKSGTDFKEYSLIKITPGCVNTSIPDSQNLENKFVMQNADSGVQIMPKFCQGSLFEWEWVKVTKAFPANVHVDRMVNKYVLHLKKDMETVIGQSSVYLDTRSSVIRTRESNCGNWIADIMRSNSKTDITFFNSGTIRSDALIPPSTITVKDLVKMLPLPDKLVTIELTKSQLLMVLETSVSSYPSMEGRFLQISGFKFTFDAQCQPFQRVKDVQLLNPDGSYRPIRDDEKITACTKSYLTQGKDGYSTLRDAKLLLNEENFAPLATLVRNYFSLAAMAGGQRKARTSAMSRQVDLFKQEATNMELIGDIYYLAPKVENRITVLNHFSDSSGTP